MKKWHPVDRELLIQKYLSGATPHDLSREHGVSRVTITARLIDYGVTIRGYGVATGPNATRGKPNYARRKNFDAAVELYNGGLSAKDIADIYGVSTPSMWQTLKRRGVIFRKWRNSKSSKGIPCASTHYIRLRAVKAVRRSIEKGLIRAAPSCEVCLATVVSLHAHHDDYSKMLDVRWLCPKCHAEWHKHNEAINKD